MTEHYTRNTESVTKWCNKCGRPTQFAVSCGRLGRCTEHEAPAETAKEKRRRERAERARRNPSLFEPPPPEREPGEEG